MSGSYETVVIGLPLWENVATTADKRDILAFFLSNPPPPEAIAKSMGVC